MVVLIYRVQEIRADAELIQTPRAAIRMRPVNLVVGTIFLACLAYGSVPKASESKGALPKQSKAKSAISLRTYVWYDGDQTRTVWLNPALVAEFQQSESKSGSIRGRHPVARLWKRQHRVRIWELDIQSFPTTESMRQGTTTLARFGHSPVFHDAPNSSGSVRSLPGNVIVYLNPEWGQDKCENWIWQHDYEVVKKLDVRPNAFILKTEPGLAALQLANTLYNSGEVVAAFPDWWLESTLR